MIDNTITLQSTPGLTIYVNLVSNTSGLIYTSQSPYQETINPAHASYYAVVLSETGGSGTSGIYQGTIPSTLLADIWIILPRIQVGGSPNMVNDLDAGGANTFVWNGSSEVYPYTPSPGPIATVVSSVVLGGGSPPNRNLVVPQYTAGSYQFQFYDINNNPYNLGGHEINFVGGQIQANLTGEELFIYSSQSNSTGAGSVNISYNTVVVTFNLNDTMIPQSLNYWMFDVTTALPVLLCSGTITVPPTVFSSSMT